MKSKRATRYMLLVEALICFGPLTAFYLMGVATLPFSFAAIISELLTFYRSGVDDVPAWARLVPIILVLGGACGLFALLAVLQALFAERSQLAYPRTAVIVMMIFGLMTLLLLAGLGGESVELVGSGLFFFWLPLLSSLHILFLARNILFRHSESVQ